MELLIVICDRTLTHKIIASLKEESVVPQMSFYGEGTADQSILSYFGLEKSQKEILLSIIEKEHTPLILKKLSSYDFMKQHGAVAFTIPLDGIGKNALELIKKTEEKR